MATAAGPQTVRAQTGVATRAMATSAHRAAANQPTDPDPDDPAGTGEPADVALKQAMLAYKRGTDNFNAGDFEAALADYKEAASLYASADFQYNIARCYEELGKHEEAVRAFTTYLRAKPDADDRAQVENRIKLLNRLIERDKQRDTEAAKPTIIVQQLGETQDQKRQRISRPLIISGAVLAGLGATAALGGGLGFGLVAKRHSDDLDAIVGGGNPDERSFSQAQDTADAGQRAETLQIALAASGAGLVAIGAVLLGVGFRFKKRPSSAAIVPRWGPRHAGLSFTGRF